MRKVRKIEPHKSVLSRIISVKENTKFKMDSDDTTFYDCGGASKVMVNESSTMIYYSCKFYINESEYTAKFKKEIELLTSAAKSVLGQSVRVSECGTQFRPSKSNRTIVSLNYNIKRK